MILPVLGARCCGSRLSTLWLLRPFARAAHHQGRLGAESNQVRVGGIPRRHRAHPGRRLYPPGKALFLERSVSRLPRTRKANDCSEQFVIGLVEGEKISQTPLLALTRANSRKHLCLRWHESARGDSCP